MYCVSSGKLAGVGGGPGEDQKGCSKKEDQWESSDVNSVSLVSCR